jgi:hypothetical protein
VAILAVGRFPQVGRLVGRASLVGLLGTKTGSGEIAVEQAGGAAALRRCAALTSIRAGEVHR